MDESKILSPEEVDALLKAAQEKENDLTKLINNVNRYKDNEYSINYKAMAHIVELTWSECEKTFSSFIRKKVHVKLKDSQFGKLTDCLENKKEKHVYSIFHLKPTNDYCLVVIGLPFLHQMINALYGGGVNSKEEIIESPGSIGVIIAEKICELALDGFCQATREYGNLSFDKIKTIIQPNLISKFSMEDDMYSLSYNTIITDIESELTFMFPVEFLNKFLPLSNLGNEEDIKHNRVWRDAIKTQVIDSNITLFAVLPEITVHAKDLLALKNGDLIPITDPTLVDVFLNDARLFAATAGQINSNRTIKILSET